MGSVPDTRLMNLRDTRLIKSRIPNIQLFYFNYTTLSEISEIYHLEGEQDADQLFN